MRNFLKVLSLVMLLSVTFFTSKAQEMRMPKYGFLDNWSFSAGIGANATFADKYQDIKPQNWGPEAWVSLNKDWSPVVGTRLQLGWNKTNVFTASQNWVGTKDFLQSMKQSPNNLGASLDFTINVLNTFLYDYDRRFNVLAIAGIGYSHMFEKHNDFADEISINEVNNYKKGNYIVPKVGLQLNYRVSDPVLIFLEGDFRVYSDKLDEIVNKAQYDGQMVLTAGITYKFKNRDGSRGFRYIPSYNQEDIDALNNEINSLKEQLESKPKEVEVVKEVKVVENVVEKDLAPVTVSFSLNSSSIEEKQKANIENIATYLKDNPDVKVSVVGYADKETGTAEYNKELSVDRAEAVAKLLVDKYGIDKSRLTVCGEGDTVQRYEKNDWNRAVIFMKNK